MYECRWRESNICVYISHLNVDLLLCDTGDEASDLTVPCCLLTFSYILPLQLTVHLLDRNEFTPLFSKSTFTVTVDEDIPIGTSVIEGTSLRLRSQSILCYLIELLSTRG